VWSSKRSTDKTELEKKVLRLVDANFNRVREGLRVCEDVFRFLFDDEEIVDRFKQVRHSCSKLILAFPVTYREIVAMRDSRGDVGKKSYIADKKKCDWNDLITSNLKRSEEGFRVLEEACKVIAPKKSKNFQELRFRLYELEKEVFKRI